MPLHSAFPALFAALLFGASTPLAKMLAGNLPPLLLAGLLYLGSGLGLGALLLARRLHERHGGQPVTRLHISRAERPWLLGATLAGGMLGPALFMLGLGQTSAASASLLLNLEGMLTAVVAWLAFRENADRRVVLGMAAIALGGVLLSWQPGSAHFFSPGALLIAGACLCWALDNNMTRKVSCNDALLVACIKGLLAGVANTAIALYGGAALPGAAALSYAALVGFLGYGLSLSLFVVALRTLGTARTGAYFSVAPLFGVMLSLAIWPDTPGLLFWAAALMGLGVWLHLSERHAHHHTHETLWHSHPHRHDAHHQHVHDFAWDGKAPHTHAHRHEALEHTHAHYPDIHHRHPH